MPLNDQNIDVSNGINDNPNSFQLKEFVRLIWINKYWVIISIVLCTSIALYKAYHQPRIYGSTAELIVLNSNSNNYTGTGLAAFSDIQGMRNDVNMFNEMEMLKSPYVMEGVVQRLNLNTTYSTKGFGYDIDLYGESPITVNLMNQPHNDTYDFTITKIDNNKVKLENIFCNNEKSDISHIIVPIGNFVKTQIGELAITTTSHYNDFEFPINVKIEPIRESAIKYSSKISAIHGAEYTSIIKLNYKDVSERRALDVLNTLMDVYNETWILEKNRSAVNTSNFINERLAVLEKELNNIDQNISDVKSSNQMPDLNYAVQNYYSQSANYDNKVFEVSNQLSIATYIKEYLRDKNNTDKLIPANSGLNSGAVETQIQEYNKLLIKRDNLLLNSTEANPVIAEMNNNLSLMRNVITQSLDNFIATNKIKIEQALSREQALTGKATAVPKQQKEILSIERQQKVKENLYLYLLEKREENELTKKLTVNNTRLVREASSLGPVAPIRKNYLFAGIGIGLLIPLGLIFLYMMLNTRVNRKEDLATLIVPFIGEIPNANNRKRTLLNISRLLKRNYVNDNNNGIKIVVKDKNRNQINEAFRIIRTNINFISDLDEKCKVMMITSFNPGSGKSFISINLASTLALKNNKRVIVVDLDLRRASLSKYVGSPKNGVSTYLTKRDSDIDNLIIKNPNDSIIDILPVGTIPPNPAELLLNNEYEKMIDELKSKYDYIILDCPPLGIVADTTLSARKVDMTIFIIRARLFDKSLISEINEIYSKKRLPNMSIILNGINHDNFSYSGKQKHNYYI